MTRKILFPVLALALCLIATKSAIARNGANATITSGLLLNDDINGLDHLVGHTSTLTYTIQIESDVSITGATLGFVLYSPDGSLTNIFWNSIPTAVGPWGDSATWNFTGPQLRAGSDEFNGSLPSNWMTGGLAFLGAGYGPTELADALRFTIRLPGVEGGVLCLDSAFQPPAGEWLLAPANGGDGAAEWSGGGGDITVGGTRTNALCITTSSISSITPCPNNATINHCEILSYRAFGEAPNSVNPSVVYSVTHTGTGEAFIDTLGNVLYQPGAGEIGSISITANASDTDGSSVDCITFVDLTSNAPTIVCPPDFTTIRGKRSVSLPANGVDVDNCDALTYSLVSVSPTPIGIVSVDPSTGAVTFDSDEADAVGNADTDYIVCIAVSDGSDSAQCCMTFTVLEEEVFSISIEQTDKMSLGSSFQGEEATVCINYEGGSSGIGGFSFLIEYNNRALAFVGAIEGNIFPDYEWEYFTYRFGPNGICPSGCPAGKVVVVGLAEQNNGAHHPTNNNLVAGDQFACLVFLVSSDREFECDFLPIRWSWRDCGDNALYSTLGDTTYLSRNVFDFIGSDLSNFPSGFRADLTDGNLAFPTTGGAPDSCLFPSGRTGPKRYIDFKNGGVKVMCPRDLAARGDININGVSYEIADQVQLKIYFIEGDAAFGTHVDASTAAGDVNCDGIPLTVADLTYMQGIIIGRFLPCTEGTGILDSVIISLRNDIISTDRALGGALFVFEGRVTPTLLASNMEMSIGMVSGNTHVLVTTYLNLSPIEFIAPGPILQTDGKLVSVDVSDTLGATLNVQLDFATDISEDKDANLPRSFALHQNYPNPFNPTTTIPIDFPRRSEYTITIYNIRGQKINQQKGVHSAGELNYLWEPKDLPSGVYFYKFQAGDFVATKKLVLLK